MARSGRIWVPLRVVASAAVLSVVLGACQPSDDSGSEVQPIMPGDAAPGDTAGLLLNEVRFLPADGEPQFVELKNTSAVNASLDGVSLMNESDRTHEFPAGVVVPPNGVVLVLFDGQDRVDGTIGHSPLTDFLGGESGRVTLTSNGREVDQVAWGEGQPRAVRLGHGGAVDPLQPGWSIGRVPTSVTRWEPLDWHSYTLDQVTPGEANPAPRIEAFSTMHGEIFGLFGPPEVSLDWYPVPGATGYRVQVSTDPSFTSLAVDEVVSEPSLVLTSLGEGEYHWQVQSLAADGSESPFSASLSFSVSAPAPSDTAPAMRSEILDVDLIMQRKDTDMLLLESTRSSGSHAWDVPHPDLDRTDPADNMNCTLASIAMINRWFGGSLSQDRIGYEIFQHRRPDSPEEDLNWGYGTLRPQEREALIFALGEAPAQMTRASNTLNQRWDIVKDQIDQGRPVMAMWPGHMVVIIGYFEQGDSRTVMVNDPWSGRRVGDFASANFIWFYLLESTPTSVTSDEPEIHMDSDGDGVVDFDEIERFETDPHHSDEDKDGIDDYTEIKASVFDPRHGYAVGTESRSGRDFDGDDLPMERDPDSDVKLDPDSDGFGCNDGTEDVNRDGEYQPELDETYNFDPEDDSCWVGTMYGEWTHVSRFDDGDVVGIFTDSAVTEGEFEFMLNPPLEDGYRYGGFAQDPQLPGFGPGARLIDASYVVEGQSLESFYCDYGAPITELYRWSGALRETPTGLEFSTSALGSIEFEDHESLRCNTAPLNSASPMYSLAWFDGFEPYGLQVEIDADGRGTLVLEYDGPTTGTVFCASEFTCELRARWVFTFERIGDG